MQKIKTAGIISKPKIAEAREIVCGLLEWLEQHDVGYRCDEQTAEYAGTKEFYAREAVPEGADLVIVLGGDGTLLSAARVVAGRNVPLFPVNFGHLGFLTAIRIEDLYPELERALRGEHRIGRRRMVDCQLMRKGETVATYSALNDIVITKLELARMIDLDAHVDDHFVAAYKADGLIISTPTGSTAYSLSAGGPVIFPSVAALCITPICPHMLTNRPVIVPDTSVIQILNHGEVGTFLTIDGQTGEPLSKGDRITCQASAKTIQLIRPPKMLFFDVLREKLKWGER
ncbi:MAG: NAD(+)/NADH kinase [Acidobacteriaceae bacterium]|nr:NAD(+)/NADH kinase [Acidobacteriaceae bacterium]MBV9296741.1 NAD(+)/NADH kinase [Acidobacteriaceae bacterium]MBV9767313.1 NAD(+)/NADH kinase [Acidobacteriaceae bacterium]